MLRVVETPTKENEELRTTLDELLQRGALKLLHETLEAEVEEYIERCTMSRSRWPDSINSPAEIPGTSHNVVITAIARC